MVVELTNEDEFRSVWPLWQEGVEQRRLLCVEVPDSLDRLYASLFGTQSAFQIKVQKARNYTHLQETNWTKHFNEIPTSHEFQWISHIPQELKQQTPIKGMMRKLLFTCPGNALHPGSFRTEQVERCVEYAPGKRFIVEVCVLSSPMYCDRFRPIVRYTGEAVSKDEVELTIESQIIYISKVNFMLKRFIEGSANGGMDESFRKLQQTLDGSYSEGIVDLLTSSVKRGPVRQREKKLESHRLVDVPLEIDEEAEEEKPMKAVTYAIYLLVVFLFILRLITLFASVPRRLFVAVKKRVVTPWEIMAQATLMLICALTVHYLMSIWSTPTMTAMIQTISTSQHGAILCFAVPFVISLLIQHSGF